MVRALPKEKKKGPSPIFKFPLKEIVPVKVLKPKKPPAGK
jgi:hypothetical protein